MCNIILSASPTTNIKETLTYCIPIPQRTFRNIDQLQKWQYVVLLSSEHTRYSVRYVIKQNDCGKVRAGVY